MEISELKRLCLLARNLEHKASVMRYYDSSSLYNLSVLSDSIKQNLNFEITKSPINSIEGNLNEANEILSKRHSLKQKEEKAAFTKAQIHIGLGLSMYANSVNVMIQEIDPQL